MRRLMVAVLITGLFAGAAISPADAKKKRKPVTFEAAGTLAFGNPSDYIAEGGLTRNEFISNCAVPASQGVDGYVIEVPAKLSAVTSNVQLAGSDLTGQHDLDMYFFNASCDSIGEMSSTAADEVGVMPPGTRYVLVSAFFGVEIEFTFNATEA